MTPKQVKDLAVTSGCCCPVCVEIRAGDLYINVPKPKSMDGGKLVEARWGNRPCKEGCGKIIMPGEVVWWLSGWGVSHPHCAGVEVDPASVIQPDLEPLDNSVVPFIPQMPPKMKPRPLQ